MARAVGNLGILLPPMSRWLGHQCADVLMC
jgi:hypothetical protein